MLKIGIDEIERFVTTTPLRIENEEVLIDTRILAKGLAKRTLLSKPEIYLRRWDKIK